MIMKQARLPYKLLVARNTLKLYRFFFPDMTICAVHGCGNSDYRLKNWKAQDCEIHVGTKKGIGRCICSDNHSLCTHSQQKGNILTPGGGQ